MPKVIEVSLPKIQEGDFMNQQKSQKMGITRQLSRVFLGIALSLGASLAKASVSAQKDQDFKFKFNFRGDIYQYQQRASNYEEAFERAAKACFNHYKSGQKLNENLGLDIIDVCANPRS